MSTRRTSILRILLGASSIAAALAVAPACGGTDCNAIIECGAALVVDAQIPLAIDAANGLALSFCKNRVCATGTLASGTATLFGGDLSVDVVAKNGTIPPTDLIFTPVLNGYVNGGGDVSDGDEYQVQVTDGAKVLLDNMRKIDFAHGSAGCRDGSCYTADYAVSPTSVSGIECHMNQCPVDVATLHGTFTASGTNVDVAVCRNAACKTGSIPLPIKDMEQRSSPVGPFEVLLGKSGPTFSIEVDAFIDLVSASDPYHDGDTYTVTVTEGSITFLSSTRTVTYDQTFPNGELCEPTPCLSTTVNLN